MEIVSESLSQSAVSQLEFITERVSHSYLDVFAKEVGIETEPVSGNVEPTL